MKCSKLQGFQQTLIQEVLFTVKKVYPLKAEQSSLKTLSWCLRVVKMKPAIRA